MTDPRRPRGGLEADVKHVVDLYAAGAWRTKGNKPLTAYRIACEIKDQDQCESLPSSGSITAILRKWEEIGFIETSSPPYSFRRYTAEGMKLGLSAMKAAADAEKALAKGKTTLANDEARAASMERHPTAYSANEDDFLNGAGDRPPLEHVHAATHSG